MSDHILSSEIPNDVIDAALKLEAYFAKRGESFWALCGVQSRRTNAVISGNEERTGLLEKSYEALREIVILCGHPDPADGEGTSPAEVVEMVRAALASPDIGPDPLKVGDMNLKTALERIDKARGLQQHGVPNQTALVWRIDLSRLCDELTLMSARWRMHPGNPENNLKTDFKISPPPTG